MNMMSRIPARSCTARKLLAHDLVSCIPTFLCPSVLRPGIFELPFRQLGLPNRHSRASRLSARLHTDVQGRQSQTEVSRPEVLLLPISCPGCGAFAQNVDPKEAGFYSATRKAVKTFAAESRGASNSRKTLEDEVYNAALNNLDGSLLSELGLDGLSVQDTGLVREHKSSSQTPVCDRCHNLTHHHMGVAIEHPTIQLIYDTIAESPHRYNHIYHVIDAADFPLSLVPNIHRRLSLPPQRSQNRRSKTGKYYNDRKTEMSFIITRSDLLAPQKTQVDKLMPYLTQVLRDALGSAGEDVRLGNVKCVSAKRGWWTRDIKEEIWSHGGGGWMVGKVNVGKSNLFEAIFPKGRTGHAGNWKARGTTVSAKVDRLAERDSAPPIIDAGRASGQSAGNCEVEGGNTEFDESSLLPPAQLETAFPVMPVVSSLPGTTASPIRLPFGNGRGELIDLPGLSRGNLSSYVRDEYQADLVMTHRLKPEQLVLKSGQSLLLGGLIRVTPTTPDLTMLACAFVPFSQHVTSTGKAIAIQTQLRESGVASIAKPGVGEKIASAGKFQLKWDVTKKRSGPITNPKAVGLSVEKLPYRIYSTDLLVEGCGWVEMVAQVRKNQQDSANDAEAAYPEIEVFSPEGRSIGERRPMNAWVLGTHGRSNKTKVRPRRSMKGAKRREKAAKAVD